ncbi:MAG: xylulokinase [Clostridiales bacterium]|jgi:xylulokinase|nr:xylulokinase [Clostridiales bacterium]
MRYLIGIDLGTSGTKTVLFDEHGKSVTQSTVSYPMYQLKNGWAEQDPNDWWNACVETVRNVISGIDPKDIQGIGISGQMHGLVLMGKDGEVLRNAIIWCDGRTTAECAEITETIGAKRLIEISANPALTGFTAGKILWVRKNEPDIYDKVRHILLPKDFLRYKLCNVFATEVSDASGMNLLNVPERNWSNEILDKLNIPREFMAKMYESCEITGHITDEAANITGLKVGTPVVGGAGDNAAAAIGTGIVETGKAFITIGTSGVIFAHSDNVTIDPKGRVHTFCSAVPGAWTVMSCTLSAGGSLQWFRNNFCSAEMQVSDLMGEDAYNLLNEEASRIPLGSDRLLFLPYIMGERSPILNPEARGVFFGLSGVHNRAHMLRAVMEGVAYSQRDCMDVFREMDVPFKRIMATGGGGRSPLWRQMLADILDCPVVTTDNTEGPALGVAILAGVGAGIYPNIQNACHNIIAENKPQTPDKLNCDMYEPYYRLYRGLYSSLKDNFYDLSKL